MIATIARDDAGSKLNVNADTAAGAVAAAMKAEKLVVVSDTHGIRRDVKDPDSRVSHLTVGADRRDGEDRRDHQRHAAEGRGVRHGAAGRGDQGAHHRRPNSARAAAGDLHGGGDRDGNRSLEGHVASGMMQLVEACFSSARRTTTTGNDIAPMKHFITISDHSTDELRHMLDVAKRLKKQHKETGRNDPLLAGKTLAMIFEKPSLRTRVSFAVAMTHLGGDGLLLRQRGGRARHARAGAGRRAGAVAACATASWPARSSTRRSSGLAK